jgi:glucosamine-6-phosphate deaminase
MTTYAALGGSGVDLSALSLVMMDEFAPPTDRFNCRAFADQHLVPLVGAGNVNFPSAEDPAGYEALIASLGGIDVFLLASGASDGHVAFNPPGSALDSRTRVVRLADDTRRDNLGTFAGTGGLDTVPTHGVTVGLATITDAREAILLLLGAGKQEAYRRIVAADGFDPAWPATVIHACANGWIVADQPAMVRSVGQ